MELDAVRSQRRLLGRYTYPTSYRMFELLSLAVFAVAAAVVGVRTVEAAAERWGPGMAVGVVGVVTGAFLLADFLSGLVHFLCDNLGSPDTPVIGGKFIKSFRDHHDDPEEMTRGDFVSVNADNFFVCLPILVPAAAWLDVRRHFYTATFLLVLVGFVVITNEAHKWTHTRSVPPAVHWLQRHRVILRPENHRLHHTAPYDSNYCITSGVLNPVLERIHFWPSLLHQLRRSS